MKAAYGFTLGACAVGLLTLGRPIEWTAIGLALVAFATLGTSPAGVRKRLVPLALVLAILGTLSVARLLAGQ